MTKLTKEERCALHIGVWHGFSLPYNAYSVDEDNFVRSTTDAFDPIDLSGDDRQATTATLFATFIMAVVFQNIDPVDCVDDLIAGGVRPHLVKQVKNIVADRRLKHRKDFSKIYEIVAPMYNVTTVYDPTAIAGGS